MGSSLQKGYINIYEHKNFRGKMKTMDLGFHLLPKSLVDKVSSIKIAPKTQLQLNGIGINTLYTNKSKFDLNLYDIGKFNDKITSLLVSEIEEFNPNILGINNVNYLLFAILLILLLILLYTKYSSFIYY